MNGKTHVFVGMSGGVDSSLTAALLVEQGYKVTGIYMKNWTKSLPGMKCPWADDLTDAKRVAVQLGIDFRVFDFETEYKHKVVDYMIDEYKKGRTPNPDIMCNQEVKFKLFLETSLAEGADLIATGHYAQVEKNNSQTLLKMSVDKKKDQTYFLYRITEKALQHTLFPIGQYEKSAVRKMALERGLKTATKKDSQGICFVGQVGIREFLSSYVEQKVGNIIDKKSGKILGTHDGAIFYTLGQRHGLNLGGGLPYYVVGKNMAKNEVYVTTDLSDKTLWQKIIRLNDVHWINKKPVEGEYWMRVRHQAPLKKVEMCFNTTGVELTPKDPERAITSGQSVVLYDKDICLGGGIVV